MSLWFQYSVDHIDLGEVSKLSGNLNVAINNIHRWTVEIQEMEALNSDDGWSTKSIPAATGCLTSISNLSNKADDLFQMLLMIETHT